jgi:hypothetical protein
LDGRIPAPNRLRPSLYCEGLGEPEDPDDFWDSDEEEELKNLNQQKAAERNNWPDEEEEEAAEESSGSGGRQRGGSFGNNNNNNIRRSPNQPQNARFLFHFFDNVQYTNKTPVNTVLVSIWFLALIYQLFWVF